MTSVVTYLRGEIVADNARKSPCISATTANITLSGEQTIDGVACVDGDRVLVKNQTDGTENGIYTVDTGTWSRAPDFDGRYDVVSGTMVFVTQGTNTRGHWLISTTGDITIGTTSLTFAAADADSVLRTDLGDSTVVGYGDALVAGKRTNTNAVAFTGHSYHENRAINVKTDYGAVGDGATDDTVAIQNILSIVGKKHIYLPEGTFLVGELTFNSNTVIEGAGIGLTTVKLKNSAQAPIFSPDSETTGVETNITIKNLTLDGNSANNTPYTGISGLIRIAGPEKVFIENIEIINAPEDAIYCRNNAKHIYIDGFVINTTGRQGVAITDGTNIHINKGYITATQNAGIDLEPNNDTDTIDGIHISNIEIENTGSYGIAGQLGALTTKASSVFKNINIANCNIKSPGQVTAANGFGMYIADYDQVNIKGINIDDAQASGMLVGSVYFSADSIVVSDVTIKNSQKSGFLGNAASGKVVTNLLVNGINIADSNAELGASYHLVMSSYIEDYHIGNVHLGDIGAGGSNYSFGGTGINNPTYNFGNGRGADIAAATTMTLIELHDFYHVTGSATCNNLNGGWKGRIVTFVADSTLTLAHAVGNIRLSGAGNYAMTANDTVQLRYNGTVWYEISRTVI